MLLLEVGFDIFSTVQVNYYHIAMSMGDISSCSACPSCLDLLFNNLHEAVSALYFNAISICLGAIKVGLTLDGWFVEVISIFLIFIDK